MHGAAAIYNATNVVTKAEICVPMVDQINILLNMAKQIICDADHPWSPVMVCPWI